MISKSGLYRFIFPFRSQLQHLLREARLDVDVEAFVRRFEVCERSDVPRSIWDLLREAAFVTDFRPDPDDSLEKVYAMGPDEVWGDLIEPLLARFRLNSNAIDFTGFNFSSIATPRDVVAVVMKVTDVEKGQSNSVNP
jgi:hypothetical protein